MSYTIRSRYADKPIYVAKGAADVREAVQAAVKAGADLTGAYLTRADLTGANLTHADLTGANLTHAYLAGADLTHAYLTRADLTRANLTHAYLAGADLTHADLTGAYLTGANLTHAYLTGANLTGANLTRADLTGANLTHAYLTGAKGLHPRRVNDLLILTDQIGKVRAYKLVTAEGEGPFNGGITYEVGKTYEAKADTNQAKQCGAGINLATLPWCLRSYLPGYRILVCEFTARDIAAIPIGDGKFRVSKCKVVREIPTEQIEEWLT